MKISPARKSAFEILLKIEKEKAFSSILLASYEENLDERDASLCHELTLGVLRNQILIDRSLKNFLNSKKKLDIEVLIALRLGFYQLHFLDKIPVYSAINESVNLTKFAKKRSASGLVNAVLRKASKGKIKLDFADEIERVSVENSHPRWLVEHWIGRFGIEKTEEIANANNTLPRLTFRFTSRFLSLSSQECEAIITELGGENGISRSSLTENCFVATKNLLILRELLEKNFIYFQDEASQMTASAVKLNGGQKFLDVCAAPGSKTTYLAAFESTNLLVAGDFYKHRVERFASNATFQGAKSVRIVRYDAEASLPFVDESFDVVLIDAPCSGTGTIRRNPEIRYSLSKEDFKDLASKQLKMLKNASKLVKRGGKIVYSTCSIEIEENEEVVNKFLSLSDEYSVVSSEVPQKFWTDSGFARTYPHRDALDGFFIATLLKR